MVEPTSETKVEKCPLPGLTFNLREQVKALKSQLAAEVSRRTRAEAALQTPDERVAERDATIKRLGAELSMTEQRRREAQAVEKADKARIEELTQKLGTVTLERDAARKDAADFKEALKMLPSVAAEGV